MNLLRRAQGRFQAGREAAVAALRRAEVVASDETGVRIEGCNAYHWVFRSPGRGGAPGRADAGRLGGARHDGRAPARGLALGPLRRPAGPRAGPPDLPGASGARRGLCGRGQRRSGALPSAALAGRGLRPGRRASPTWPPLHWPPSAGAWIGSWPPSWPRPSGCELTRALQAKIGRARDQLLVFLDYPGQVEATNNACERALRPAVIQRKVTNGYRAMWAAEGEAAVRTVVDTARLTPATSVFGTILKTVSA